MDPAIDGHENSVIQEESRRVPQNDKTNPASNLYEVQQRPITESQFLNANPWSNRTIKIINPNKRNAISGKPVGYKISPAATQLLLADPKSVQYQRVLFASHHLWVTKYKDGELYAGGRYTLQSQKEIEGVADAVARKDAVDNTDVVVWNVFGLTHNPRVEDWPIM